MPDSDSAYNGFKMNSIDVAIADAASGSKYGTNRNLKFVSVNTNDYSFISVNHGNKLLKDAKLRRIIKDILSTSNLTSDLLPEYAVICSTPVNPDSVYAVAEEQRENNIKEELQNAGYQTGSDGLRTITTDGKTYKLDFNMLVCSDNPTRMIVGEYIASSLLMYGIYINVQPKSAAEYQSALYSGKYDLALCETRIGLNCDLSYFIGTGGKMNTTGYSSPEMDDALFALKSAGTEQLRSEGFKRVQEIFLKDTPHIPLYFTSKKVLYNGAVIENITSGDINYEYNNINGWMLASGKEH